MRNVIVCFGFLICFYGCKKSNKSQEFSEARTTENVITYDFKSFENEFLKSDNEKIRVINYWATWCRPCVKELPFFEALTNTNKKVEVILVSLDLNTQKETKLIPFINKHQLKSKVIHLDEPDADAWISKVAKDWSGAIPATLIIGKNKQQFYEQSFNYEQLVEVVKTF